MEKSCTALLAINLAEPTWISVTCQKELLTHVICHSKANHSVFPTESKQKFCHEQALMKSNSCYLFVWSNHHMVVGKNGLMKLLHIDQLVFLFDAISVILPAIIVTGKLNLLEKWQYHKIHHTYYTKVSTRHTSQAFQVLVSHKNDFILGMNIFQCRNGTIISYAFVCNRLADCSDNEDEDEIFCNVDKNYSQLSHRESLKRLLVAAKWPLVKIRNIIVNIPQKYDAAKDQKFVKNVCLCEPDKTLPHSQIDDLVADCAPDCPSDEYILTALLMREGKICLKDGTILPVSNCSFLAQTGSLSQFLNQSKPCSDKNFIPCRKDHPKCYPFLKICSFQLDTNKHLSPCRNGGHLVECEHFECNAMFKCKRSYCIPWVYICDNKWDCPEGEDENYGLQCGQPEHCQHMFKCKNAKLCIYFGYICDKIVNCPAGDDEYFCELNEQICPNLCVCHIWVVVCNKLTNYFSLQYPAKFLLLVNSTLSIVHRTTGTIALFIDQDPFKSSYCSSFPHSLLYLYVHDTWFDRIKRNCFQKIQNLSILLLPHNNISIIETFGLGYLSQLVLVNLSLNPLQQVSENFLTSDNLVVISLRGPIECIKNLHAVTNLKFIYLEVSDFSFCCLDLLGPKCNMQLPWFYSCQWLLNRQT